MECRPSVSYIWDESLSSTTKTTPYEVVCRQHSRSSIALIKNLSSQGIEHEEDLPVEIQDSINEHADHPQGIAVDDRSESIFIMVNTVLNSFPVILCHIILLLEVN